MLLEGRNKYKDVVVSLDIIIFYSTAIGANYSNDEPRPLPPQQLVSFDAYYHTKETSRHKYSSQRCLYGLHLIARGIFNILLPFSEMAITADSSVTFELSSCLPDGEARYLKQEREILESHPTGTSWLNIHLSAPLDPVLPEGQLNSHRPSTP